MNDDLLRGSLDTLRNATSEDELSGWYRDVLGRKGTLSEAMRTLGSLTPDERRERGQQLNAIAIIHSQQSSYQPHSVPLSEQNNSGIHRARQKNGMTCSFVK